MRHVPRLPGPFVRYPGNPILGPTGDGWEAKDVFNPAAWTDGESVFLLYRAEDGKGLPGRATLGMDIESTGLQAWVAGS